MTKNPQTSGHPPAADPGVQPTPPSVPSVGGPSTTSTGGSVTSAPVPHLPTDAPASTAPPPSATTASRSTSSAGYAPQPTPALFHKHSDTGLVPSESAAAATAAAAPGSAGGSVHGAHSGRDPAIGAVTAAVSTKRASDPGGSHPGSQHTSPGAHQPGPGTPTTKGQVPPAAAGAAGSVSGSSRGRLQQLGHRLNFVTGLGRKKHATFAPGVGSGEETAPTPVPSGQLPLAPGSTGQLGRVGSGGAALSPTASSATTVFTAGGAASYIAGAGVGGAATQAAGGGGGLNGAASFTSAAAFNPPNHPVNPFSYLATPFRVMAKSKAGAAMGR